MDEATARVSELARLCARARSSPSWNDGVRRTTAERFARFYAMHGPLLRATIATWAVLERAPSRPFAELGELARVVLADDALLLDLLWGGLDDGLSYVGTEQGWVYGGQPWEQLCVVRSGIELLEVLVGHDDASLGREARETMDLWTPELFRPVEIPEGIPASHRWWRGPPRA